MSTQFPPTGFRRPWSISAGILALVTVYGFGLGQAAAEAGDGSPGASPAPPASGVHLVDWHLPRSPGIVQCRDGHWVDADLRDGVLALVVNPDVGCS